MTGLPHPVAAGTVGSPYGTDPLLTGRAVATITNLRLLDGTLATLTVDGDRIASVGPAQAASTAVGSEPSAPAAVIDATGWRYLPAATEPHAHLDKALTAHRGTPAADNSLVAAINQWQQIMPTVDAADLRRRALDAITRYVANGITTIRTHVDALVDGDPLRGVAALLDIREQVRSTIELQVCLLASEATPTAAILEAIEAGIDVIGGCPHLTTDPTAETRRLLDLAEQSGLPVDLHTDEQTDPRQVDLIELAEQVLARGMGQRVAASHCVRLAMLEPSRLAEVLALVERAGIGIITLPITNLYLQGREARSPIPRAIPPLRAVLDAGVRLAAGGDNFLDPFLPVGRADPFETTSLLVTAGQLSTEEALAAVTSSARELLGLRRAAAEPGCAADLLLVPDRPIDEILAGGQPARVVIHGGRVVADTRVRSAVDPALVPTGSTATPGG